MKYYAEFFSKDKSTIIGSDSVFILDGRQSIHNMIESTQRIIHKRRYVSRSIEYFRIYKGNRFNYNNQVIVDYTEKNKPELNSWEEFVKMFYYKTEPDKFNWKTDTLHLPMYYSNYFKLWWDEFSKNCERNSYSVKLTNERYSRYMPTYCSELFNEWWDPERFNWIFVKRLKRCCGYYKNIWEKDYLLWKLKQ